MGENKYTVEIKKEKLKYEMSKDKPNYKIIKRLKDSIKRHKKYDKLNKLKGGN